MSKSIPDRWLEYKPYGKVIPGTRILPFKVPLKNTVNSNLSPEKRFTTSTLLEAFPRIKAIIDLTNTNRYYAETEFTNSGIKYKKIMVPGHEVPTTDVVKKFYQAMDEFLPICGEDGIIGVHCTHGINRTGYLICRYLIQQLGWEVEDCLKKFEEARGYSIERQNYLQDLRRTRRQAMSFSNVKKDTLNWRLAPEMPNRMGPMRPFNAAVARQSPVQMGPRPPFPHMPPLPPPGIRLGAPPMFGPKPFRYRPPGRPAMPPLPPRPGLNANFPGLPIPGFPTPGPSRLPQGLPPRLPPSVMPLPRPTESAPVRPLRPAYIKQLPKPSLRGGTVGSARPPRRLIERNDKLLREQDFTIDTFEENLVAVSGNSNKRRTRRDSNRVNFKARGQRWY